jgi:hypothetical protein
MSLAPETFLKHAHTGRMREGAVPQVLEVALAIIALA